MIIMYSVTAGKVPIPSTGRQQQLLGNKSETLVRRIIKNNSHRLMEVRPL